MGSGVLAAVVLDGPSTIRAYAHCAADDARDLVVLLLNLEDAPVDVALVTSRQTTNAARTEWHFTAGSGGLGGAGVQLGGTELAWVPGQPLPLMPGVTEDASAPVHMEQQSIVFVRLHVSASVGLC